MKKRGLVATTCIITLVFFVLFSASALADYYAEYKIIKNNFEINSKGEFKITIYNNQSFSDKFFISSAKDLRWNIETEPQIDYISGITINPLSQHTTTLFIIPTNDTKPGRYILPIMVISEKTNTSKDINLDITLLPESFEPNISVITSKAKIDPRQKSNFRIIVKNNNPLNLKNLTISINGKLIKESAVFDLSSNEEKSIVFTLDFGKKTEPQTDVISITVLKNGQILYNGIEKIEILPYGTNLEKEYVIEKKFLRTIETIKLSNPTNSIISEEITIRATIIDRIFSKTNPQAKIIEQAGKKYYAWEYTLKPDEKAEIKITKNYTIPAIILLIIIILCFYFILSKPAMIMRKETLGVKSEHGSIKEIKIRILMKNKKPYPLHDVRLIDRIPHFAKVDKDACLNPPTRLYKHSEHGQIAEWSLGNFDPGEKKEVTYTIQTTLAVIGTVELKSAMAKFKVNNKQKKAYSNSLGVTVAQPQEED